jgi:hypothetical protein
MRRPAQETAEQDLFRSRLNQIIDLKYPQVALGRGRLGVGVTCRRRPCSLRAKSVFL